MRNMTKLAIVIFFVNGVLSGCALRTRTSVQEAEQKQKADKQLAVLQQKKADDAEQITQLEDSIREIRGQVEALELKSKSSKEEELTKLQATADKFKLFEDSITKLEDQMRQLLAEVAQFKDRSQKKRKRKIKKKLGNFKGAEVAFSKKQWQEAIRGYQKYRELNPKGKSYGVASYRMGVSFQALGLKDEAKTYYKEVLLRFPKSKQAKKSKIRLDSIK